MTWWQRLRWFLALDRIYSDAVDAARKENPTMDKAKSILVSKTFWFNALAGIYAFAQSQGLIASIPAPWGEFIVLGGNILLRLVSAQPVTLSLPGAQP